MEQRAGGGPNQSLEDSQAADVRASKIRAAESPHFAIRSLNQPSTKNEAEPLVSCYSQTICDSQQPPPTLTLLASGSTWVYRISERSMTRPSLQMPSSPPLCPPPPTETSRLFSRPKWTAAMTSATSAQRAISRGRL